MPSRRRSREKALQILYLRDIRGQSVEEATADYYGSLASEEATPSEERDLFAEELVSGVALKKDHIDRLIEECSTNWRLDRMAVVDRNLIRLAAYDMAYANTPPPVAIKEALQLAERYCDPESVPFVNGLLDALSKLARGAR
jgi:N utilization substance protein B